MCSNVVMGIIFEKLTPQKLYKLFHNVTSRAIHVSWLPLMLGYYKGNLKYN